MLYYNFSDYEDFKEIFGIVEHGNGVKSRKNKILLSLYKDRQAFKDHIRDLAFESAKTSRRRAELRVYDISEYAGPSRRKHLDRWKAIFEAYDRRCDDMELTARPSLLTRTLPVLKNKLFSVLTSFEYKMPRACFNLHLQGRRFWSDSFETDSMDGLCEDGTFNAIRYRNIEKDRVFKMKAGKMFNHLLSCNVITDKLPEQIKRWLSEEFVGEWIDYARREIGNDDYKLHVDDNFSDIYDRDCCAGYDTDGDSFGSCMVGDDQWYFYRDAVKAKAAYLTDSEGMIVARCIVFTDVHEVGSDKIWRLAERQYSKHCEPALQRQLVSALILGGHIDGHKVVGASCGDACKFVDCEGNSLEDKKFWINCNLEDGDTLSYQDSFKWYDHDAHRADNYGYGGSDLATTSSEFSYEDHRYENWSAYNDEYISEDDAVYVESRDDYFYPHQTRYARYRHNDGSYHWEDCFEDDVIEINGEYYYAGEDCGDYEDYGIRKCENCGEYFLKEDGYRFDENDEWYCCDDCYEEGVREWHEDNGDVYSEYDEAWYGSSDDVITALQWIGNRYFKITISVESFNEIVEDGEATEYCGRYYIDDVNCEGEPVHFGMASSVAA